MHVNPSESDKKQRSNPLAVAFSIGIELVVSVLLGVLAGKWADAKFGTEPALLLVGVFTGITVGLYLLIRRAKLPKNGTS
ncbi:MAG: AtpZ/AtpI family protein [Elusimicrobiota bacterium]